MKKTIGIGIALAAIAAFAVTSLTRQGESQPSGATTITIGIYAPTVPFASSQARLQYVQSLAKAIETSTGARVQASSFTSLGQLTSKRVDFAIIEGQCHAENSRGNLLAIANVSGGTSRSWALYSSQGPNLSQLSGKRLAYVKTGCDDTSFIENAMLESEVSGRYFSGKVAKPDVSAAVAEVASRKGAEGVFAPVGQQKGLTKVFDTGSVPNPAFVQLNTKLSKDMVNKVQSVVRSFGGGGAISGWEAPNANTYKSLRARMGRRVKRGIMSDPSPVRVDARDVLLEPDTLDDTDLTPVGQHFEAPPARIE
jgi:hypothetical protein